MSKNTNIADLINYISVDGSGNVVLTTGGQVATQSYVTTAISNLVNAAPTTLDTLNELAAALGNDANFATTVTNSIATKLPLSGGTLTGPVAGTQFSASSKFTWGTNTTGLTGQIFTDNTNNYFDFIGTLNFRGAGSSITRASINASGNAFFAGTLSVSSTAIFSSSVSGTSIRSSSVGTFGFNTANNGEFQIYATAADGMVMAGRGSTHDMVITNKSGSDVFRIPTGTTIANFVGNVGIGTSSPYANLDLGASGANNIILRNTSNAYNLGYIGNAGGKINIGFSNSNSSLDPLPYLSVTSGGNVLIGTATDNGFKLQVSGSQYISSYLLVGSGGYSESPISLNAAGVTGNGQTDLMMHITNTKYSSANSSGESRITFGWANHWGAAFGAYKQGVNLTGFRFYGEQGYNTPVQILEITAYGLINSVPTYNNTSGGAASIGISASGEFYRSTSSLKYKKNVRNYDKGLEIVRQLRPVYYESKNKNEDGIIYAGLIAEEIHDLGLTEFVQYATDDTPDALAYQNMVALLTKAIQEQQAQIEELKARLN